MSTNTGFGLPSLLPYRALRLLGEGGTGRVFLAEHPATLAQVALKVLHLELANRPRAADEVLQLAEISKRTGHPNLVEVLDAGILDDGRPFVAMEHLEGRDLGDELAKIGALDYQRVIEIARGICAALVAVHGQGLVHRDIKPGNLFLVRDGDREEVKLLDLGLTGILAPEKQADFPGAHEQMLFGTPEYWSPEQACGQAVDGRSDLYSLGVVMYEALCGRTPFSSHSVSELIAQHVRVEPAMLAQPPHTPTIPRALSQIVLRCLKKNPDKRFQSAGELAAALARVPIEDLGTGAGSAPGARQVAQMKE